MHCRALNFILLPATAFALGAATHAFAQEPAARTTLHGHVPAAIARSVRLGRLPADRPLRLCLGLPLRHTEQLEADLRALYDPTSPRFRRFLTPDQFNAAYGPTEEAYTQVKNFARANGMTIVAEHPDRRQLDVDVTAANAERAFGITLHEYDLPAENRRFYAPEAEPSVDTKLPVADIWGLSDYPRPRPMLRPARPAAPAVVANAGSGPSGSYRGYDFRNAYVPGLTNLTGAGQTIGLFQVDGFYANDIINYAIAAGLPTNIPLSTVLLDGFSGTPNSVGGNGEVSLDIEMVISMAPGLSQVIVYEGNPNRFYPTHVLARIASDNLAKQVSSSWSWSGGPSGTVDTYLQQMIAQGQSYFQATGDSDAYLYGAMDASTNTTAPVDSPYLTAVGGTTLTMTSGGGARVSETVWNWGGGVGSSGGISSYYAIPSWQQGVSMASNQGSTVKRNIPDVALTADDVYVVYNNGSADTFGGTSCAAPLWAGFCALVNQQAAAANLSPVGFLNPSLYAIGKGAGYATAFHDVTTGDNTSSASPTNFYAVAGYDLCTGWGTPNGAGMIAALLPTHLVNATLSDVAGGNGNGYPDPGETIQENVVWAYFGSGSATGVTAVLSTAAPGVTLLQTTSAYPDIPSLATATNLVPFRYRLARTLPAGTVLTFTNVLSAGGQVFTGTFTRVVGEPAVVVQSAVTNTAGRSISSSTTIYVTNLVSGAAGSTIDRVTAGVRLNFSRDSYLVIALQHPDGTEVVLANGRGGSGSNYGTGTPPSPMVYTVFDDDAATAISAGTAPFAGSYRPDGVLGNLDGKAVNGAWRLRLTDTSVVRTGTFYSWTLALTLPPTALIYDQAPVASNQSCAVGSGAATNLLLRAADADADPLTFRIASPPSHGVLAGFDTNSGAITYTAAKGYTGTDLFAFVANDGWTDSVPASVSISILPPIQRGAVVIMR